MSPRTPILRRPISILSLGYLGRGNFNLAHDNIVKYLARNPDDARALRQSAYIDAATNNFPGAMASLETALAKSPDWALLYFDAAATSAMLGRTNQALDYLAQAETKSSPTAVLRLYKERAFTGIRSSPPGRAYEKELSAKIAGANAASTNAEEEVTAETEPIASVPETATLAEP